MKYGMYIEAPDSSKSAASIDRLLKTHESVMVKALDAFEKASSLNISECTIHGDSTTQAVEEEK